MTKRATKLISKLITKTIWFSSIVFIVAVLLLSLLKVSLPYWLNKKDSIIAQLESTIGGDFDYSTIQVDWSDFHPVISIRNLSWKSPDEQYHLTSNNNHLTVDFWKTLYLGSLATKEIEVHDVKLIVGKVEDADQQLQIDNLLQEISNSVNRIHHEYISVSNAKINVENDELNVQNISNLVFKKHKHKKQLVLKTDGDYISNGMLVIEANGWINSKISNLDYYVELPSVNLPLLAKSFDMNYLVEYQDISIKAWGHQKESGLEKARLELKSLSSKSAKLDVALNLFLKNDLYQVNSERFEISLYEQSQWVTHKSYINVNSKETLNGTVYYFDAGKMPVAFIKNIISPIIGKDLGQTLKEFNSSGIINQANVVFSKQDELLLPTDGFISVSNFTVAPTEKTPGIELNELSINGKNGLWDLTAKAEDNEFDWQPNFKSIIKFDELLLNARYNINESAILDIGLLKLSNKDSKIQARAKMEFADELYMAIYAEAKDIDVSKLHLYWPRNGSFSEKTLAYLDNSLLGGEVPYAKFLWRGKQAQFPYLKNEGVFDVQAKVSDVDFKFEEDWPVANRLSGNAYFKNEKMEIEISKGDLLGAKVKRAKAIIPDLKASDEKLLIHINADTDALSYKKIYQNSPLLELLGDDLLELEFDAPLEVDLAFDFLLAKNVDLKLDGKVLFEGHNLGGIPYDIQLDNTHGELNFTHNGAVAENLQANYLGQPFDISIKVEDFTDDESNLQIDAEGMVNLSNVAKSMFGFGPIQTVGSSQVVLHYKLYEDVIKNESLIFRTNLVGSEIYGPAWLGKKSMSKAPLLVTIQKIDNKVQLRASYKDQLSTQLSFDTEGVFSPTGLIKLGSIATQNIEVPQKGLAIEGYFDEVVLHKWLDAFQFPDNLSSSNVSWVKPEWIDRINITTPRLEFANQVFTKVRINDEVGSSDDVFRFNLYSEQARANVSKQVNGRKKLIIEQLDMDLSKGKKQEVNNFEVSLGEYDNWLFECISCKVNGFQFGPVSVTSDYVDDEIKIRGQATAGNYLNAGINGTISNNSTSLDVFFDAPNPSELMEYWEIDGGIRDTKTTGQLNLDWEGRLHDFDLQKTQGAFKIKTGQGSIKDLSDRKARIFSLFSLQSIPRRLSLDFSDIFRDGFFYDEIVGNFRIENGVLIAEKVEIKGTAADVKITGSVDLNNQTVNQEVLVIPKLGSSLPVLAGWAIEPTTGLIMLIVSKIFEPALNVVSQIEYKITGALDDPIVEEVSKKSKEVKVTEEQIEAQKQLDEGVLPEVEQDQEGVQ